MILNVASFGYCEEGLRNSHGFQVQVVKGRAGTLAQRRDKQWWSPSVYCQVCAVLLWQWSTAADLWLAAKHPGFFPGQDFLLTHCKILHVLHQWQDQAQAASRCEAKTSAHDKQLQVQGTCPAQRQQGLSLMSFTGFQKMHLDYITWDFFFLIISENWGRDVSILQQQTINITDFLQQNRGNSIGALGLS